jgi:hypothetical protein
MQLSDNPIERTKQLDSLAKQLFAIDMDNNEFHFVLLSSLISLLLEKGIITEEEFSKVTDETTQSFKALKMRNSMKKEVEKSD